MASRLTRKLQKEKVLAAYEACGNVTKACKKLKLPRDTFYTWLKEDKDFKAAYDAAAIKAVGVLEDEANRRAVEGVLEPVYHKGEKVGTVRRYSDTLLIVLLKAHAPEKYRERVSTEISGKLQTDTVITTTLDIL